MVLVLMGVAGAGKTTVGRALARRLHFEFFEGDDFHSPANRMKMREGIPLTDADRRPWLEALRDLISRVLARGADAVVACSALRQAYRDFLAREGVRFVYLEVSPELARERLAQRTGHFFDPGLLGSQFATLEAPRDALDVDASRPVAAIVDEIARRLGIAGPALRERSTPKQR